MANLPTPENGDAWLNSDTKTLKYHLAGQNYSLVPQNIFIAGDTFDKSGYVVSLNSNSKVIKTDSATVTKALGINTHASDLDGFIEIQSWGLFHFNEVDYPTPPFNASDIGKTVYVSDSPDGQLTTDINLASIGSNNIIVIGQISSERDLVISIEGDGRGPLDYSEMEYTTGEEIDISFTPVLVSLQDDGFVYKSNKKSSLEKFYVVGFIVGANTNVSPLPIGTKVIVRKIGKLNGFSGLTPGKPVYAGGDSNPLSYGTIIQNPDAISVYYDKYIQVGIARSNTEIDISILPPYSYTDGIRVGDISLCDSTKTEPDTGYLFMDGSVLNAVTNPEYQELYDIVGNTWGGIDNTNFVLENLNTGLIKYQIKYKKFFQFNPTYTPIYQIEYPSHSSWEIYENTDKTINTSSFGILSAESIKELDVKIYARKDLENIKIAESITYNPGTGNKYYGYTIKYIDENNIQIVFAPNGLAYFSSTTPIELNSTWEIKIIVIKNERFNRYRDIIDDASLGSLLDWVYLNDKNLNIKGTTFFENTLDSTTSNDGSVVLKGGIGIEKNVNIGDSVTIKNNLQFEKRDSYFSGTRLSLKSEEILYEAIQDTDTISIQENTETFLDYSSAPEPQRIFKDDENNLVFLWYTNSTTITYEVYSLDIEGKYTEKIYSGSFTTLINMDMVDWDYPDNLISGSIPKGIIPYYTEDFDTYVFHNIYLYNYLTNTTQTYVIEDTGVNYADIIVHKNWFYVNIRKSEETTKYIYYYEDNTYWSNIFSEPISIYYPNPKGKDYIINSTNTLICLNGQYSSIYNFSGSAISKGTDVILSYSIGTATLGVYQWDELTYILLYLNTGEYNYSIITIDALFTTITITKALTNVIDAQITGSFFNTDFSGVEFILDKTKKLYYYSSVESGKTKFHLFDYDNSLQTVTYSSSVILTDETGTNKVTCFLPLNSNQVLLMYDYAGYPSYMFFKSIIYGCIPDWNESAIFFRDSSQIKIDTLNVKDIILTEIHEVAPTSEDGVEGQIWIEI